MYEREEKHHSEMTAKDSPELKDDVNPPYGLSTQKAGKKKKKDAFGKKIQNMKDRQKNINMT